jgi:2-methylisocitrate lyase-like PEP mutase family enzyme
MPSAANRLRALLDRERPVVMPCCFDALSARLIEQAGFSATFMSGFAVSAARLALPDTGLISFAEMLDQGRTICQAIGLPVIGDGDTGYGNAMNVKRTVRAYAQTGFAAVMIEDQVAPKRCGHTQGKAVVGREEAVLRIRAACDARDEGADILILARTDARATHGMEEALARARAFAAAGADLLFVEAPRSEEEMATICREVPGRHLANMLEGGATPLLPPDRLAALGFSLIAYPLTLLAAAVGAMRRALEELANGRHPEQGPIGLDELRRIIGFDDYDREADRYRLP